MNRLFESFKEEEIDYLKNIYKKAKSSRVFKDKDKNYEPWNEIPQAEYYESRELIELTSFFSESKETASNIETLNPAAFYDLNSRIKELSDISVLKYQKENIKLLKIANKAQKNMSLSAEITSFGDSNSNIFDFYGGFSDLRLISQTISDICSELQEIPDWVNSKESIKIRKNKGILNSIKTKIESFVNELTQKTQRAIVRIRKITGVVKDELIKGLGAIGHWLKENIGSKFLKAIKWFSEKVDQIKLFLYARMFDFVRKVVTLALEKNWKIKEINVGMPEIGVTFKEVAKISIPIPSIKEPVVSYKFIPLKKT